MSEINPDNQGYYVAILTFSSLLMHESHQAIKRQSPDMIEETIRQVRKHCDDMEVALMKELRKPVRTLTPEEYQEKMEKGKKITLVPDEKPQ